MPLYEICPQCQRVPVTKRDEKCDECKAANRERAREAQRNVDLIYGRQLEATKPPKRGQRNRGEG